MRNSDTIFGALIFGFLIYTISKGSYKNYFALFTPKEKESKESSGGFLDIFKPKVKDAPKIIEPLIKYGETIKNKYGYSVPIRRE